MLRLHLCACWLVTLHGLKGLLLAGVVAPKPLEWLGLRLHLHACWQVTLPGLQELPLAGVVHVIGPKPLERLVLGVHLCACWLVSLRGLKGLPLAGVVVPEPLERLVLGLHFCACWPVALEWLVLGLCLLVALLGWKGLMPLAEVPVLVPHLQEFHPCGKTLCGVGVTTNGVALSAGTGPLVGSIAGLDAGITWPGGTCTPCIGVAGNACDCGTELAGFAASTDWP